MARLVLLVKYQGRYNLLKNFMNDIYLKHFFNLNTFIMKMTIKMYLHSRCKDKLLFCHLRNGMRQVVFSVTLMFSEGISSNAAGRREIIGSKLTQTDIFPYLYTSLNLKLYC